MFTIWKFLDAFKPFNKKVFKISTSLKIMLPGTGSNHDVETKENLFGWSTNMIASQPHVQVSYAWHWRENDITLNEAKSKNQSIKRLNSAISSGSWNAKKKQNSAIYRDSLSGLSGSQTSDQIFKPIRTLFDVDKH